MPLLDNVRALLEVWNLETETWDVDSEEYVSDLMGKLNTDLFIEDLDNDFVELDDDFSEGTENNAPDIYSDYTDEEDTSF